MLRVVAELGAFCSLCPFHRFQTSISVASGQISHSTASPSPTGIFRGVTQALLHLEVCERSCSAPKVVWIRHTHTNPHFSYCAPCPVRQRPVSSVHLEPSIL
jgi:hypothetical protein